MSEIWETVTQSQVFNWIKLVNQRDIESDCLSITTQKITNKEVQVIEDIIGGKFIKVKDYRRLVVSDLYISFVLLRYYFKNILKYDKIIYQTRLGSTGFTFALLQWLPKAKFIFEGRGAGNEERIFTSKENNKNIKGQIKTYFSEKSESLLIKRSDRIMCVSNSLEKYYRDKFKIKKDKFSIIPGAADSEIFFNDKKSRALVRDDLNLSDNDLLIVYSGKLDKKWEIPDKIISFFKYLTTINNDFKLLLLTPDTQLANKYIKDYFLAELVFVKQAPLNGVNKYLNASDFGLLLREDTLMNNVASPTKFAEYLMSGLPVIISKGVHDFANIINQTGYGVVVERIDSITPKEYNKLLKSLAVNRDKIAIWGYNHLSKKHLIDKYISVLNDV